ncbi:MAG: mandelate racemase/muconate lactonizing enzyme family protein [Pirellulaceae bacterium]
MQITHIETFAVEIPLKPAYRMITALGAHDVSRYVLVRVRTDEGIDGVGEATVSVRWSGETVWGAYAVIEHVLAPAVVGCDPRDIVEIDRRLDLAAVQNWFAKSAIEMACWDIAGRAVGKPVYELLGGACRPRTVLCRFSLGAYDVERAQQRARELIAEGFETIKVKVGGIAERDIARVRAVREVIGPDRGLTIDANCGWDADTAIHCIRALESSRLALVEQPTPNGDYGAMARVRRETRPPVMADDICFDLVHAQELVRNECCDVLNLYPGKQGGIRKARLMAEYAASHGLACSIGSNLELDVGTAAMAHFVVSTPNMRVETYPGDMLGPVYHEASIATNPVEIHGPRVTVPAGPGLGVDVDWQAVRDHRCPGFPLT